MKAILALGLLFAMFATVLSSSAAFAAPQNMETCFSPEEKCDERLISFLGSATRSLDVTLYNLTHRGILKAIEDARVAIEDARVAIEDAARRDRHCSGAHA